MDGMNETIRIYTDGSTMPKNPGPSGAGAVILYPDGREFHLSQYLGDNLTNNIAELNAILLSVQSLKNVDSSIRIEIYSDSQYSIGALTKNKAIKNKELIQKTKDELAKFEDVEFFKVKAHATDRYNNLADQLANDAVRTHKIKSYL